MLLLVAVEVHVDVIVSVVVHTERVAVDVPIDIFMEVVKVVSACRYAFPHHIGSCIND